MIKHGTHKSATKATSWIGMITNLAEAKKVALEFSLPLSFVVSDSSDLFAIALYLSSISLP